MRQFFSVNGDLFVRSLCLMGVYLAFSAISARFGDTLLAMSSIMMKLMMIFSYFTDGFAFAGEALTGRFFGRKDKYAVSKTVKWTFIWSMGIGLFFVVIYAAVLLIVNMLNNVFRFPALRHLDWILGGLFGLVRGLVIVMLIFAVVPTISSALSSMNITLLTDLIDASRIGKIFQNSNFVANTLQSILS